MQNQAGLLTDLEVARYLRVSVALVRRWRVLHAGPKFIKVGGALVRYRMEDVDAYLEACRSGGGRIALPETLSKGELQ